MGTDHDRYRNGLTDYARHVPRDDDRTKDVCQIGREMRQVERLAEGLVKILSEEIRYKEPR